MQPTPLSSHLISPLQAGVQRTAATLARLSAGVQGAVASLARLSAGVQGAVASLAGLGVSPNTPTHLQAGVQRTAASLARLSAGVQGAVASLAGLGVSPNTPNHLFYRRRRQEKGVQREALCKPNPSPLLVSAGSSHNPLTYRASGTTCTLAATASVTSPPSAGTGKPTLLIQQPAISTKQTSNGPES